MDQLLTTLADWKPFRALVVGDFMLDQQFSGIANRLSPDAPVPVLKVTEQTSNPGGAANLCLDLIALKAEVVAFGIVGDDAEATLLRDELTTQGIDASGILIDPTRPTTVKRNLVGLAQGRHAQKMFRLDFESDAPIDETICKQLLDSIDGQLAETDIVCIEDYNKGVCTDALCRAVIERAEALGKPVFVDPAPIKDYAKYRGASGITPNRTEAELATGLTTSLDDPNHNAELAHTLMASLDLDAVVLTLDKHGAVLLEAGNDDTTHIPTVARAVYDVTGAGDMMLAALAAGRANGLDWTDATRFANAAAGLEVEVFGVEPIALERIHNDLLIANTKKLGKRRTLDELMVQVRAARNAGQSVVFTNGCFDVIHAGHVSLLEKAATLGDMLIVAMNDDHSVHALKGDGRPVNNQDRRARVLGALACVDAVVLFNEDTPIKLIEAIVPDVLVKGGDYTVETVVGAEVVQNAGGRVALIDLVEGLSTTATIEKMRQN